MTAPMFKLGEVPFPKMGEGLFFCFELADLSALETRYGTEEYMSAVDNSLQNASGEAALLCLEHGLKKKNEDGKRVKATFEADELDFNIMDMHKPVMDALCIRATGKDYEETLAEIAAEIERLAKEREEAEGNAAKLAAIDAANKEDTDSPLPDSGELSDISKSPSEQESPQT